MAWGTHQTWWKKIDKCVTAQVSKADWKRVLERKIKLTCTIYVYIEIRIVSLYRKCLLVYYSLRAHCTEAISWLCRIACFFVVFLHRKYSQRYACNKLNYEYTLIWEKTHSDSFVSCRFEKFRFNFVLFCFGRFCFFSVDFVLFLFRFAFYMQAPLHPAAIASYWYLLRWLIVTLCFFQIINCRSLEIQWLRILCIRFGILLRILISKLYLVFNLQWQM